MGKVIRMLPEDRLLRDVALLRQEDALEDAAAPQPNPDGAPAPGAIYLVTMEYPDSSCEVEVLPYPLAVGLPYPHKMFGMGTVVACSDARKLMFRRPVITMYGEGCYAPRGGHA